MKYSANQASPFLLRFVFRFSKLLILILCCQYPVAKGLLTNWLIISSMQVHWSEIKQQSMMFLVSKIIVNSNGDSLYQQKKLLLMEGFTLFLFITVFLFLIYGKEISASPLLPFSVVNRHLISSITYLLTKKFHVIISVNSYRNL